MLPRQCLALILALACVPPAWAGMDKEGSSQRPGLFFAWLSPDDGPVWAQFENPATSARRNCRKSLQARKNPTPQG